MSGFASTLNAHISKQMRGKKFTRVAILNDELLYHSDILVRTVVVPVSFASDGASVPRFLWSIYPPFGIYLEAAIIHDWHCVAHEVDYITAAKVFREAMEVCGVGKFRRNVIYWAVRLGGPKFQMKVDKSGH